MPHTPHEPDANYLDAHRDQISTGARCSLKQGITYVRCSYEPVVITAAQMFTDARCSQQPIAHMNLLT